MGCHFLLQGIFPTQGSNLGLPHYRQTLYHLSHQYQHQMGATESALSLLVEKAKTASSVSLLSLKTKYMSVSRQEDPCLAFRSVMAFPSVMPPWGNHPAGDTSACHLGPGEGGPSAVVDSTPSAWKDARTGHSRKLTSGLLRSVLQSSK